MRVILRNTQTGLYYAGPDKWTELRTEAMDFHETDLALDQVSQARLGSMELLMHFDNPQFEIPLAIAGLGS